MWGLKNKNIYHLNFLYSCPKQSRGYKGNRNIKIHKGNQETDLYGTTQLKETKEIFLSAIISDLCPNTWITKKSGKKTDIISEKITRDRIGYYYNATYSHNNNIEEWVTSIVEKGNLNRSIIEHQKLMYGWKITNIIDTI